MRLHLVVPCALLCAFALLDSPAFGAAPSAPILTVAGTGTACSAPPACGDGAAAVAAQLAYPEGVAVDSQGNAYVADWGSDEVRRIAPDGTIAVIAGSGTQCWSAPACGDGGPAVDAALSFPEGVAVGPDGSVYIADSADNEVRKVSPRGKITRLAGSGAGCSQPPSCGDGGPATTAQLSAPAGVAVDKTGNVYVADTGDSEIRKVSPAGVISRVAGTGVPCASAPSCGDAGPAAGAELNFPGGVALDTTGSMLISDAGDNEVRRVSASGTITRVAGNGKQCAAPPACGDGAAAASAQLNGDDGVAAAPDGSVYIADAGDNEVRRVTAGKISLAAGNGAECSAPPACGDAGPATGAALNYPDGIAIDSAGALYVADTSDSELRWVAGSSTATLTPASGKVVFSAFAATVAPASVTVRCALSAPAGLTLTTNSAVVARSAGRAGFDALTWDRRLGGAPAPRGRYTLTVTASAGGRTVSQRLTVSLR